MGRPPIDPADRRNVPIKAFVTVEEKTAMESAAKAAGRSLSDWIRMIGMEAAHSRPE
jgi:uncharacterized protein (DUF1778 family)